MKLVAFQKIEPGTEVGVLLFLALFYPFLPGQANRNREPLLSLTDISVVR
jgi:hypothetical protein